LPAYMTTILTTFAATTLAVAAVMTVRVTSVRLADDVLQVALALLVCAAALLAARSRRRLKAVLLLGVTGYGIALLFVLHGAPDLALTQAVVETVTLVVF